MSTPMMVAPGPVAFARICIGLAAIATAMEGQLFLTDIAGGKLAVPYVDWWPSPEQLPLEALLGVMVLAGFGLVLGFLSSWCAGAIVVVQIITMATDQQLYSSHRELLVILCCHLVFARADASWSLRARLRGRRPLVPLWPQWLMVGVLSVLYLFAGLSKINGIFLSGEVLRQQMILTLPDQWYVLLAYATVVAELFLAFGLWFPTTRLAAIAVGIALHVSIVALLGNVIVLTAFALLCVGLYPMVLRRPVTLLPWDRSVAVPLS